jgi:hypothetical protein
MQAVIVLVCLSLARPAAAVRGDADCNGKMAAADLPAVITALFERGPCADADVNGDGIKSASDVTAELQQLYGPSRESAFEQVLDQIEPDGTITLDTARQLFQLTYGGLDDVIVPDGAPGPSVDGTIALRAMLQHRDNLSVADAARLDEVLNVDGPVSVTIEPGSTQPVSPSKVLQRAGGAVADVSLPAPLPSDNVDVQDFMNRVIAWLPEVADAAQVLFTLRIEIAVSPVPMGTTVADSISFDANKVAGGGAPVSCRIRFFQGAINQSSERRDNTVTHELWHCFEALIIKNGDTFVRESDWIIEGQAEYVAAKITKTESGWFGGYLVFSTRPLFARDYTAIGFYVTMESNGAAMFSALKAMLVAAATAPGSLQSNQAAFDAAMSATPRLLDTWGEMEFQDPLSAGDWNYAGSPVTGLPPPPQDGISGGDEIPGAVHLDMDDGSTVPVQVPAHSVFLWKVNLTTDFIHFQINGAARLLDESGSEYNDLSDLWLCQHPDPDQCKCPEGSEGKPPESQPVMSPMKVAASAGNAEVDGSMTSISLEELCTKKPPPPPNIGGGWTGGINYTYGDSDRQEYLLVLSLREQGSGTLSGTAVGKEVKGLPIPSWTEILAGPLHATLAGTRTGDHVSITLSGDWNLTLTGERAPAPDGGGSMYEITGTFVDPAYPAAEVAGFWVMAGPSDYLPAP